MVNNMWIDYWNPDGSKLSEFVRNNLLSLKDWDSFTLRDFLSWLESSGFFKRGKEKTSSYTPESNDKERYWFISQYIWPNWLKVEFINDDILYDQDTSYEDVDKTEKKNFLRLHIPWWNWTEIRSFKITNGSLESDNSISTTIDTIIASVDNVLNKGS